MPPLILGPGWKTACVVLQLVPLPGVGAIIAGTRNPHSRLLGRGVAQLLLVVFGSWPLIIPGAVGLAWAILDAVRIGRAQPPPPWSEPTLDADPQTLDRRRQERLEARQQRRALRLQARAERLQQRAQRAAQRGAHDREDDETRWMP